MKAGCCSGGNKAIFCLNSKTIRFCSSVSWVMAAAVAAADPTGCTTVGVVDDVVDDADDVVVVVVPALTAGGSEITWLPTVWVYLIGVDLVTVTLGTGMDLDTGGCWKIQGK